MSRIGGRDQPRGGWSAAIEVLQSLRSAGARIEGASHYLEMLLNGRPGGPASETEQGD